MIRHRVHKNDILFFVLSVLCRTVSQSLACHVIQVLLLLGPTRLGLSSAISEDAANIRCGLARCRENETCIGPGPDHADSDCYHCKYLKAECGTTQQRPHCHRYCEDLLLRPLRDEIQRLNDDAKMTALRSKNDRNKTCVVMGSLGGCILVIVAFSVFFHWRSIVRVLQMPCQTKHQPQQATEATELLPTPEGMIDETVNNVVKPTADTGTQTYTVITESTPVQAQQDNLSCKIVSSASSRTGVNSVPAPCDTVSRKFSSLTDSMYSDSDTSLKLAHHTVTRSESDLNILTYEKIYLSDVNLSSIDDTDMQSCQRLDAKYEKSNTGSRTFI